jgi:hypothetical protein
MLLLPELELLPLLPWKVMLLLLLLLLPPPSPRELGPFACSSTEWNMLRIMADAAGAYLVVAVKEGRILHLISTFLHAPVVAHVDMLGVMTQPAGQG